MQKLWIIKRLSDGKYLHINGVDFEWTQYSQHATTWVLESAVDNLIMTYCLDNVTTMSIFRKQRS